MTCFDPCNNPCNTTTTCRTNFFGDQVCTTRNNRSYSSSWFGTPNLNCYVPTNSFYGYSRGYNSYNSGYPFRANYNSSSGGVGAFFTGLFVLSALAALFSSPTCDSYGSCY